jgi:hypothetical protein
MFKTTNAMAGVCLLVMAMTSCSSTPPLEGTRESFATPEEAMQGVMAALRVDDLAKVGSILGPSAGQILDSGDPVEDRNRRAEFVKFYDERNHLERPDDETAILHVGTLDWPFPVPIIEESGAWYFDTEEGVQEVLDRRIGRNELSCVQTCLAFHDAQVEYVKTDWDKDGVAEYAQLIRSTERKQDGLYWSSETSMVESPLGVLAADAAAEGYDPDRDLDEGPIPYHGYFYRVLHKQGPNAEDGAYTYLAGDSMIGGFAVLAYPAVYGSSGVMSFMLNHMGTVYEKDLGDDTEKMALTMTMYDPDGEWEMIEPAMAEETTESK